MSLTWHIVKKDLRRMALPVGMWVALIVATTVGFRLASLSAHGNGPAEVMAWVTTLGIWTRLLMVGEGVMGCLLVAATTLEDGLQGTNAFWMTRPIPPARLLAAKAVAAALLFVAAPTIALIPVWLACGLGWQSVVAAAEFAFWQAAVVLPAVTVASLSSTLAGFLFSSVGLLVGPFVAIFAASYLTGLYAVGAPAAVNHSRSVVIAVGMVVAMITVLVHQYITRHTARSWMMVGLAIVASILVRVAWPWQWDVWTAITTRSEQMRLKERPEDRAAEITTQSLSQSDRKSSEIPALKVTAPWTSDGFYMPVLGLNDKGAVAFKVFNGYQEAGERAIGFSIKKGLITWRLGAVLNRSETWLAEGQGTYSGKLEIWFARSRVLGEMPLREGGEVSNGAARMRIVGLLRTGEQLDAILVEEHGAEPMDTTQLNLEYYNAPRERTGLGNHLDAYFLVDRAHGRVQSLQRWETWDYGLHPVTMNSLTTAAQKLFVGGTQSWEGAVVIVVRFERDHAFTRPFTVQATTDEPVEGKP